MAAPDPNDMFKSWKMIMTFESFVKQCFWMSKSGPSRPCDLCETMSYEEARELDCGAPVGWQTAIHDACYFRPCRNCADSRPFAYLTRLDFLRAYEFCKDKEVTWEELRAYKVGDKHVGDLAYRRENHLKENLNFWREKATDWQVKPSDIYPLTAEAKSKAEDALINIFYQKTPSPGLQVDSIYPETFKFWKEEVLSQGLQVDSIFPETFNSLLPEPAYCGRRPGKTARVQALWDSSSPEKKPSY